MSYNYPPQPYPQQGRPGQYPPQQPGQPFSPEQWSQPFPPQSLPPNAQPVQQQWNPQPQMQQPYQQPMYAVPPMMPGVPVMATNVSVNVQQKSGPGFLVRAIYFLCIGWWFGYLWLIVGFSLCALILTLPLGLVMLNRLPQVMTLKQSASGVNINVSTTNVAVPPGGVAPTMMVNQVNVNVNIGPQQRSFLLRAVYFLLVGSWVGFLWAHLAYVCCASILLLPIGVMMFDRLPAVLTLRRG